MYNIIQCKIDYCIIKLILIMLVWKKNGSEKNIYALWLTIEVSRIGEAAEECELVGKTQKQTTYTPQIFVYAKYVI